jgi:hypothetical protein
MTLDHLFILDPAAFVHPDMGQVLVLDKVPKLRDLFLFPGHLAGVEPVDNAGSHLPGCHPGLFKGHGIGRTDPHLAVFAVFVAIPLVIGGLARGPDFQKKPGQPGVEIIGLGFVLNDGRIVCELLG